jgi:hypothetical protein
MRGNQNRAIDPHRAIDPPVVRDATAALVRVRGLIREATLAASSYNTQPWKFRLDRRSVSVLPDFTRRCPVLDPDDHHLYVSLGCATENLACGARANGLFAYTDGNANGINVVFDESMPIKSSLYDSLPSRQCSRSMYDGRPLSKDELERLERAARGRGVHTMFLTERPQMEAVLEYVTCGIAEQMRNPHFVRELAEWVRFDDGDIERTGDGVPSRALGRRASPPWLGRLLMRVLLTKRSQQNRCAGELRSSSGIAVFLSDRDDPQHWIEVGRSYERFALQATALGIRNAFLNPAVEVPAVREQFAKWLGAGDRRPDLIVRFGRGPETARTPRRPLEQVLV